MSTPTMEELLQEVAKELNLEYTAADVSPIIESSLLIESDEDLQDDPERGVVRLELASDGSVTGYHSDFMNSMKLEVDLQSIRDIALTGLGIVGGIAANAPAFSVYSLTLGVIWYVYKGSIKELHSSDAEVLYAISLLDKIRFTKEEVQASYLKEFQKQLDDRYWERAVDKFVAVNIFLTRRLPDGRYKLEETITVRRK